MIRVQLRVSIEGRDGRADLTRNVLLPTLIPMMTIGGLFGPTSDWGGDEMQGVDYDLNTGVLAADMGTNSNPTKTLDEMLADDAFRSWTVEKRSSDREGA